MPSRMVMIQPMLSLPGFRKRATSPTIRPMMMVPMMPIGATPQVRRMAIDTCIRTRGAPHSSLRCRRSVPNNQRLNGGDLAIQGGAVRATQRGVADLAPGLERLAVVMQVSILDGNDLRHWRHFADEVEHGAFAQLRGRAQRQAGDGPQMVLELAALGTFDGPVPGVVHARRDFVGLEPAVDLEELEGQHADII